MVRNMKYSYWIILKQIYLSQRWDPYKYYQSGSEWVLHYLQNWSFTTRCSLVSYPFFGRSLNLLWGIWSMDSMPWWQPHSGFDLGLPRSLLTIIIIWLINIQKLSVWILRCTVCYFNSIPQTVYSRGWCIWWNDEKSFLP